MSHFLHTMIFCMGVATGLGIAGIMLLLTKGDKMVEEANKANRKAKDERVANEQQQWRDWYMGLSEEQKGHVYRASAFCELEQASRTEGETSFI